jgi:hypothetical protein
MERLKQTITKLENDVAELKQFQTKTQGSTQSKGDVHYCTSTQEFGEYSLDEIDTFRFAVTASHGQNNINMYCYRLLNPIPELIAYLRIQGKNEFSTEYIPVDIENFEEYCMKKGGTPFVLTDEIRKCLDSKLWEFAANLERGPPSPLYYKGIANEFFIDIPITFEHEYTISPHVSLYITPLSNALDECGIHEITTNQVVFRVKYGNLPILSYNTGANLNPKYPYYRGTNPTYPKSIYSGLKLHYNINGIVKQNDNLLELSELL